MIFKEEELEETLVKLKNLGYRVDGTKVNPDWKFYSDYKCRVRYFNGEPKLVIVYLPDFLNTCFLIPLIKSSIEIGNQNNPA